MVFCSRVVEEEENRESFFYFSFAMQSKGISRGITKKGYEWWYMKKSLLQRISHSKKSERVLSAAVIQMKTSSLTVPQINLLFLGFPFS